jgi:hypothetical protein
VLFPDTDEVAAGDALGIFADGFAENASVEVTLLCGDEQSSLGLFEADSGGVLSATVDIPADAAAGECTLEAAGENPSGGTNLASATILVTSDATTTSSTVPVSGQATTTIASGGGSTGGSLPYTGGDSLPIGLAGFVALVTGLTVLGALRMREGGLREA